MLADFIKLYGYQVEPVVLGVILARPVDENWRRAILSEREDLGRFFLDMVSSPLTLAPTLLVLLTVLSQTPL